MKSTTERFNELETSISKDSFRHNKGLSNEVAYYIFDYPPDDELLVRDRVDSLNNASNNSGFHIEVFDLYEMVIGILDEKHFLQKCFQFEEKQGMDRIVRAVGNMLRLSDNTGLIVEKIRSKLLETTANNHDTIIFITGVGKIYPVLRSHKVLNNLHQAIDDIPVVMFYPGIYDNQKLMLFGSLRDDNYYRAFRIVD